MDLEITGKKENKALQRQEVVFEAKDAKVTPSRKELKPKIAAMMNSKPELTVIKKIGHPFGKRAALINVNVYESEEALKKAEAGYLINRDLGKKKAKGEEKPAEKPAEEGKEEKPSEKDKGKKPAEGKKEEATEKPAGKPVEGKPEAKEEKPADEKKEGDK